MHLCRHAHAGAVLAVVPRAAKQRFEIAIPNATGVRANFIGHPSVLTEKKRCDPRAGQQRGQSRCLVCRGKRGGIGVILYSNYCFDRGVVALVRHQAGSGVGRATLTGDPPVDGIRKVLPRAVAHRITGGFVVGRIRGPTDVDATVPRRRIGVHAARRRGREGRVRKARWSLAVGSLNPIPIGRAPAAPGVRKTGGVGPDDLRHQRRVRERGGGRKFQPEAGLVTGVVGPNQVELTARDRYRKQVARCDRRNRLRLARIQRRSQHPRPKHVLKDFHVSARLVSVDVGRMSNEASPFGHCQSPGARYPGRPMLLLTLLTLASDNIPPMQG